MARRARDDEPFAWHHVMNRGIARRTVFESRDDCRYFLALLARAVRRRQLEVHAFCLMSTHFHLLIRSPKGDLSEAMRRIQNEYVRRFNRSRRRDGPLFRGRFRSKRVDSLAYRHVLVRYIDANPISAGLVVAPDQYPYGSARMYLRPIGPPWLERSWIEREVRARTGLVDYQPSGYAIAFGGVLARGASEVVESRLEGRGRGVDPLDDLVHATPDAVLSWMRRKARLADGSEAGLAVCDPASVAMAAESARAELGAWAVRSGQKHVDAWSQVHAGLLRDLSGLTLSEVGARLCVSTPGVSKLCRRHRASLLGDDGYAARVRQIAMRALRESGVPEAAGIVNERS